jgi:ABC-2 type transport system ATP-binding protein
VIVHADSLWKRFGRFDALQGLSFTVPEGSTFSLIGANGAGKSTTIKVIMNLIGPTSGAATVLGVDTRAISPRELAQIGYVSENQDMPGRMTVSAYIDYLRTFYPTWDRVLEANLLAQFRLPLERRIRDLSHGMRLKMSLACALPFRPKLLVLDEPFSGLDPLVRDELLDELKQQAGRTTILISSHELSEIEEVTTHIAFLDHGTVLFQEAMSDLTARLRHVSVTLEGNAHAPTPTPAEWLDVRIEGNVLSFIDTRFSERLLAARLAAMLGPVRHIDAQPVALRAMYTTLARAARKRRTSA